VAEVALGEVVAVMARLPTVVVVVTEVLLLVLVAGRSKIEFEEMCSLHLTCSHRYRGGYRGRARGYNPY
jgi:hypothetical protein